MREKVSHKSDFFKTFDQSDLLKTVAALQLVPENHGKNVRLEIFAREIINQSRNNNTNVPLEKLIDFFQNNFRDHYLEDPLSSLFTENIIFFAGNFIVFPGLNHNGTRILSTYLEAIFTTENDLPEAFKKQVRDAMMIMGTLSNSIARKVGLPRYKTTEKNGNEIVIPNEGYLNRCKEAVTLKKEYLEKVAAHYDIDLEILREFVADAKDVGFNEDESDANPLLRHPLVADNEEFIFVLPTAVINCLTEFIFKAARRLHCDQALLECYYKRQWYKVREMADEIGWSETDIKLPEKENGLSVDEAIFRFDNEKLAYVCLVKKKALNELILTAEDIKQEVKKDASGSRDQYENRADKVIDFLEELNGEKKYKYLTLFIVGECGVDFAFLFKKPKEGNQTLSLSFGDFEKLVFSEEINGFSLWKFAKVYNEASKKTKVYTFGGMLDAFVIYRANQESILHSDEAAPDFLHITVGDSVDFEREVIKKRDEHAVLQYTEHGLIPMPVKRLREFAPIYIEREKSRQCNTLLEYFKCPVWVKNNQAKSEAEWETVHYYCEAIIFWIYKMREALKPFFDQIKNDPIEITIVLADTLFHLESPFDLKEINPNDLDFNPQSDGASASINIPAEISHLLIKSDNEGEKAMMRSVLKALKNLFDKKNITLDIDVNSMRNLVDESLYPANAKMILFFDTSNELRLDTRWLLPLRKIQDSEVSMILDKMVSYLNLPEPLPEVIQTKTKKNTLCNQIVGALVRKVIEKQTIFNSAELLKWLMKLHEKCIQTLKYREINIPAKIACFSDFPSEVKKLQVDNSDLVRTSIALRCSIEFIAASPSSGSTWPNMDDIDELLALMDQVIAWGQLSDTIHLEIDDPKMGILPSGRIGVDKTYFNSHLKPFELASMEDTVFKYQENFAYSVEKRQSPEQSAPADGAVEVDTACVAEWGISMTKLLQIKGVLVRIALEKEDSIVEMEETLFLSELRTNLKDIVNEKELSAGLKLLTLTKRKHIDRAPSPFEQEDIYPWKYNRALSYLRKPLIKINHSDSTTWYYWSFRHILSTAEHLQSLLFQGRLKAKEGGLLNKFVKKVNTEKGHIYRDMVAKWIKQNSGLTVIDYELVISENGHLKANKNYGDIDIPAIDLEKKIFYSIECKNTVGARTIHEMKTEMDKYLGRNGTGGMIAMHVERDKWLKENVAQLEKFTSCVQITLIKSLVITSEEIPVGYLGKEKLPLPIISFSKLKRTGASALEKL